MVGKLGMTIYFSDGGQAHFVVDSVFGWTYSGDYLLVHTEDVNGATTRPYPLGEIAKVVMLSETIH